MSSSLSEQLSQLDVDNIFLYVADAVREDKLPASIRRRGITADGIASSTHSPASFASIASGLHPPTHGVQWFSHTLENFSVFDIEEVNTYYESSMPVTTGSDDSFFRIFDIEPEKYHRTVPDFEPPFFAMERGHGGHAPYSDDGISAPEYFEQNADSSTNKIIRDYEDCVENDAEHFLSRVSEIEDRGLLEDTLVIYTSDHGELLGEGGMLGHNAPMRPELVRVPTVFIHPDIDGDTRVKGVVRHIDIFPTIRSLLGVGTSKSLPGRSLVASQPAETGLSFYDREFFSTSFPGLTGQIDYEGVWDRDGGHVLTSSSIIDRLAVFAGKLATGTKRKYLARNISDAIRSYVRGNYTYGHPRLSRSDAWDAIREVNRTAAHGQGELSEAAMGNLQDLGYR